MFFISKDEQDYSKYIIFYLLKRPPTYAFQAVRIVIFHAYLFGFAKANFLRMFQKFYEVRSLIEFLYMWHTKITHKNTKSSNHRSLN